MVPSSSLSRYACYLMNYLRVSLFPSLSTRPLDCASFNFFLHTKALNLNIPGVMKTGSANLTFCVTFHNFSSLSNISLFTVLFTADVGFFRCFLVRDLCRSGCTRNYHPVLNSRFIRAETERCDIVGFSKVTTKSLASGAGS